VAQLQLNAKDDKDTESKEEVEKQLWSVLDPGSLLKRDDNRKTFLAWLGNDIGRIKHTRGEPLEKCRKITMPWATWPDFAYEHYEMELDIDDPNLPTLPLVMNVDDKTMVCVDNEVSM
ncbi:hypothetical protein DXG01_013103, partial [Tephrocybe rancida]